jgi:hypothetical protein
MPHRSLHLKFPRADNVGAVSRKTLRKLAKQFGISEEDTIQLGLIALRDGRVPSYAPDDGPLTKRQLDHYRRLAEAQMHP